MEAVYLGIVLSPLLAALIVGLGGRLISRPTAHWVTIIGVLASFLLSLLVLKDLIVDGARVYNGTVYHWAPIGNLSMEIGFLILLL